MRKLLLIGGTGGIGKAMLEDIPRNRYQIVSIGSEDLDVLEYDDQFYKYQAFEVVVVLSGIIQENDLSQWSYNTEKLINVNCVGATNILCGFLPWMRDMQYGRIIFMSSVFSEINIPGMGVYSASKAFVDKLVKIAAIENAKYGVTVNSIQLGYTGRGMGSRVDPEIVERSRNKPEMKRFCTPREIWNTINYLVDTEYITGQNIRLDGGIR